MFDNRNKRQRLAIVEMLIPLHSGDINGLLDRATSLHEFVEGRHQRPPGGTARTGQTNSREFWHSWRRLLP